MTLLVREDDVAKLLVTSILVHAMHEHSCFSALNLSCTQILNVIYVIMRHFAHSSARHVSVLWVSLLKSVKSIKSMVQTQVIEI